VLNTSGPARLQWLSGKPWIQMSDKIGKNRENLLMYCMVWKKVQVCTSWADPYHPTKVPHSLKAHQTNTWHEKPIEPIIIINKKSKNDGSMFSFGLCQILTLPSECLNRNRDSSDQATFFSNFHSIEKKSMGDKKMLVTHILWNIFLRLSKWGQHFQFCVNYPFKSMWVYPNGKNWSSNSWFEYLSSGM